MIQKYQDIDTIYAHIDEISGDVKQKLIDGKEYAYTSRSLIELKDLDEVKDTDIKNFVLDLDLSKYKKVLIEEHHFNSFGKPIDELKKKLQMPVQTGLF